MLELIAVPTVFAADAKCGTEIPNSGGYFDMDNSCTKNRAHFDEDQSCSKTTPENGPDSPDESCGGRGIGESNYDYKDESCAKGLPNPEADPDNACGKSATTTGEPIYDADATCDKTVSGSPHRDTDQTCGKNVNKQNGVGYDADNYCDEHAGGNGNPYDKDESCTMVINEVRTEDETCSKAEGGHPIDPDENCTIVTGGQADPDASGVIDPDGDGIPGTP